MDQSIEQMIINFQSLRERPIEYMRPVVLVLVGQVRNRIHTQGKKADGSAIGTYSSGYMSKRRAENRGNDKKMIYSLTRQMEQDFVPIAENDIYGLGFNNKHNLDKANWQEESRPGVYTLSQEELTLVEQVITDYINGLFG